MQETVISISIKKIASMVLLVLFVSTASAQYYNDPGTISNDEYFSFPDYDSQTELVSQLVAPFIFVAVLLNFALSRALRFILANDSDDPWNDPHVAWAMPGAQAPDEGPNVKRYSMIMSIAITASIVPTPYWNLIRTFMASIGIISGGAIAVIFVYGFYKVVSALN